MCKVDFDFRKTLYLSKGVGSLQNSFHKGNIVIDLNAITIDKELKVFIVKAITFWNKCQ